MSAIRDLVSRQIIDVHAHIASTDYFAKSFMDGVFDNMMGSLQARGVGISRDKVAEMYLSRFQDPDCDQLVAAMDEAAIRCSVLQLADFTWALPGPGLTIAEMVARHIEVVRRHAGRLLFFAGVDPRWGSDGLSLFERGVNNNSIAGYKVYPPCGFRPSDKQLYPFYEICSARSLPVLIHIGATSPALDFEPARPIYVDQAARDFPRVNFILAHGSVHYPDECAMMCSHRPNVYLDVSGYEVSELSRLRELFELGINHKVLFGTDWPLFRLKGSQKDFVDVLTESEDVFPPRMPNRDIECFFFRNAARILGSLGAGLEDSSAKRAGRNVASETASVEER